MKAVITVTGRDSVGIIALVSAECAVYDANILEISQSVLSGHCDKILPCLSTTAYDAFLIDEESLG